MSPIENKTSEAQVLPSNPMQSYPPYYTIEEDSIDLLELWKTLMSYKWMIAALCILVLTLTKIFLSFVPAKQESFVIYNAGFVTTQAGVLSSSKDAAFKSLANTLSNGHFLSYVIQNMDLNSYVFRTWYQPESKSYDLTDLLESADITPKELAVSEFSQGITLKAGNNAQKGAEIRVLSKNPVIATTLANALPALLENYVEQGLGSNLKRAEQQSSRIASIAQKNTKDAYARLTEFRQKHPQVQGTSQGNFVMETLGTLRREKLTLERKRGVLEQLKKGNSSAAQNLDLQIQQLAQQIETLSQELSTNEANQNEIQLLIAATERQQEYFKIVALEQGQLKSQISQFNSDLNIPETFIRIVEPAKIATSTLNPRLIMVLALVLAIFLGIVLVFILEFFKKLQS